MYRNSLFLEFIIIEWSCLVRKNKKNKIVIITPTMNMKELNMYINNFCK